MEGVDRTFTSESDSANSRIPENENLPSARAAVFFKYGLVIDLVTSFVFVLVDSV